MPAVSVIIPVYNTEKYLRRCLDSVCNQTLKDIEIICVNDASPDDSAAILAGYAARDPRVKVIAFEQNRGVGAARNVALDHAIGDFVMFCDSDDWYESTMCERMFWTMQREQVDLVQCHCRLDFEPDVVVQWGGGEAWYNPPISGCLRLDDAERLKTNGVLWNKLFRRETIERYGIRFSAFNSAEDSAFCCQYFLVAGSIWHLPERLYHHTVRNGSESWTAVHVSALERKGNLGCVRCVVDFALRKHIAEEHLEFLREMIALQYRQCIIGLPSVEHSHLIGHFNDVLTRLPGPRCRMVAVGNRLMLIPCGHGSS